MLLSLHLLPEWVEIYRVRLLILVGTRGSIILGSQT